MDLPRHWEFSFPRKCGLVRSTHTISDCTQFMATRCRTLRLTAFSKRDLAKCTFCRTKWQVWSVNRSYYWVIQNCQNFTTIYINELKIWSFLFFIVRFIFFYCLLITLSFIKIFIIYLSLYWVNINCHWFYTVSLIKHHLLY